LETEAAEERDLMPKIERVLVGLDASANARLAGRLAGWLVGAREITSTVIDLSGSGDKRAPAAVPSQSVVGAAEDAARTTQAAAAATTAAKKTDPVDPATDRGSAVRPAADFRAAREGTAHPNRRRHCAGDPRGSEEWIRTPLSWFGSRSEWQRTGHPGGH
jgi:hypothetical protein